SDVPGLLRDVDDPSSIITQVSAAEIRDLIGEGVIQGGMIPKIEACLEAIDGGVRSAHLLDGRIPHVVLLELFTDEGIGTMIVADDPPLGLVADPASIPSALADATVVAGPEDPT